MKKATILFSLLAVSLLLVNCGPDDDVTAAKLRDYQTQYEADIADIEKFLKTHSYEEIVSPGDATDGDVIFHDVEEGDPNAIWNSPLLTFRTVEDDDIEYKLYYLKLREGGGAANDKPFPCNVDAVLAAYTGKYLFHLTETDEDTGVVTDSLKYYEFETNPYPQSFFNLEGVIKGWSEIFPQFRGGDEHEVAGEPTLYTDFGAGVMFIPSGLGYYQASQSAIPAYSPLIFTFKLYEISRPDQDGDGIPSYLEDIDGDRYIYIKLDDDGNGLPQPDDTDGDGAPNYLDLDDDGDQMLTEKELLFDAADENSESFDYFTVPDCSGNAVDPARVRRYVDPACQGSNP